MAVYAIAQKLYQQWTEPTKPATESKPADTQTRLTEDKVDLKATLKGGLAGLAAGVATSVPATVPAAVAGLATMGMGGFLLGAFAAKTAPVAGAVGGLAATRSDSLAGSMAYGAAAGAVTQLGVAAVVAKGSPGFTAVLAPAYVTVGAISGAVAGAAEHAINRK